MSPLDRNFYAFDSFTYDTKDVLIEVDSTNFVASCKEIDDSTRSTAVLNSLYFTPKNNLVAIFAGEMQGSLIDVQTGVITKMSEITSSLFGDMASAPYFDKFSIESMKLNASKSLQVSDLIFENSFELDMDLIFENSFEIDSVAASPLPVCVTIDF